MSVSCSCARERDFITGSNERPTFNVICHILNSILRPGAFLNARALRRHCESMQDDSLIHVHAGHVHCLRFPGRASAQRERERGRGGEGGREGQREREQCGKHWGETLPIVIIIKNYTTGQQKPSGTYPRPYPANSFPPPPPPSLFRCPSLPPASSRLPSLVLLSRSPLSFPISHSRPPAPLFSARAPLQPHCSHLSLRFSLRRDTSAANRRHSQHLQDTTDAT